MESVLVELVLHALPPHLEGTLLGLTLEGGYYWDCRQGNLGSLLSGAWCLLPVLELRGWPYFWRKFLDGLSFLSRLQLIFLIMLFSQKWIDKVILVWRHQHWAICSRLQPHTLAVKALVVPGLSSDDLRRSKLGLTHLFFIVLVFKGNVLSLHLRWHVVELYLFSFPPELLFTSGPTQLHDVVFVEVFVGEFAFEDLVADDVHLWFRKWVNLDGSRFCFLTWLFSVLFISTLSLPWGQKLARGYPKVWVPIFKLVSDQILRLSVQPWPWKLLPLPCDSGESCLGLDLSLIPCKRFSRESLPRNFRNNRRVSFESLPTFLIIEANLLTFPPRSNFFWDG